MALGSFTGPLTRVMCASGSITLLRQLLYTQGATQRRHPISSLYDAFIIRVFPTDAAEISAVRDESIKNSVYHNCCIPSQVEEENTDGGCLPHFKTVPPTSFFYSFT